jgi:hypothetical protein
MAMLAATIRARRLALDEQSSWLANTAMAGSSRT